MCTILPGIWVWLFLKMIHTSCMIQPTLYKSDAFLPKGANHWTPIGEAQMKWLYAPLSLNGQMDTMWWWRPGAMCCSAACSTPPCLLISWLCTWSWSSIVSFTNPLAAGSEALNLSRSSCASFTHGINLLLLIALSDSGAPTKHLF